jgi:hypothetical protein
LSIIGQRLIDLDWRRRAPHPWWTDLLGDPAAFTQGFRQLFSPQVLCYPKCVPLQFFNHLSLRILFLAASNARHCTDATHARYTLKASTCRSLVSSRFPPPVERSAPSGVVGVFHSHDGVCHAVEDSRLVTALLLYKPFRRK